MTAPGTLSITRRWGGPLFPGPFPLSLDGVVVASLRNMETVDLPVEAGSHTVVLGAGRHRSPARSFEVAGGEVVSFWCRGTMFPLLCLAALAKPDLWITLRRV